jgi:hypothetical protein
MRQQERSLWLASFLPASWFCVTTPTTAPVAGQPPPPETCTNTSLNTHYMASLDASMTTERVGLSLSGTTMQNPFASGAPTQTGLFGSARLLHLARVFRIETTGTASSGTYMDLFSGSAGPGFTALGDRLDVALYYRRSALRYRVSSALHQDAVGGYATFLATGDLLASLLWEGTTGNDVRALMGSLSVVWRPRF